MKDKQYYFSHDANAKDDPKCTFLIESLGLEGYGIFWVLVETLRTQSDYKYPIKLIPALARKYNTTADKMSVVINHYDLFIIEDDMFFSLSLNQRMEEYENKRLKHSVGGKIGMEKRWKNDKLLITNLQESYNYDITIKEKKRKEKENKIEDNICSEAENKFSVSTQPENVLFTFETKKDSKGINPNFYITTEDVEKFQKTFKDTDILQELEKIHTWHLCNLDKKKTFSGMPRFLFTWLNKTNQKMEIKNEFAKNRNSNYTSPKEPRLVGEVDYTRINRMYNELKNN